MILELIVEALRNLARHKLRSFLTALGIVFGIASVMAMVEWPLRSLSASTLASVASGRRLESLTTKPAL